ncbi:hypothetical protein [Aquisphaera insulae]|uniref:hypothetical protein n=1 Tax=Aquisphaera insulae TaxID=2712864 RepID=UPI0013EA1A43|nr:hypothetical protein [Aquisphaera insulae]
MAGGSGSEAVVSPTWPRWAKVVVSLAILYHVAAVVAGAIGVPPSSPLERRVADAFTAYHDLVDQGYAYRYYAEPPPTPVATAVVRFDDGRPDVTVRLPDRSLGGPRMRHQRQLALANALFADVQEAKRAGLEPSRSRMGRAYARHLGAAFPGSRSVTLHVQQHLIPSPDHVRRALAAPGNAGFDLFDEDLFTSPEWVGDYECDRS